MKLLLLVFVSVALCHKFQSPFSKFDIGNYKTQLVEKYDPSVKISATPNLLHETAQYVRVRFEGVQKPSKDDWIGVYSPSDVDVKKTSPVKYKVYPLLLVIL